MLRATVNRLKVVGIAVLVLIVLIVVLENTQGVETRLLFLTVTMPNAALMFGTLIIGFVIGVLAAGRIASRAKRKARHTNQGSGKAKSMAHLIQAVTVPAVTLFN